MFRAIVFASLTLAGAALAEQDRIEIIPLRYSSSETLLPVLRPLLPDDARVTGYQNQLIIRADSRTIAEVVQLITSLDRAPRQLRITIDRDSQRHSGDARVSASTRILVGNGEVVLGEHPPRSGTRVQIGQRQRHEQTGGTQQIQTVEGQPALIRSGREIPVIERYRDEHGASYSRVGQQDATAALYAVARIVNGDEVIIDLYTQDNRAGPASALAVREAETTLHGRVGQWIEFAGANQQQQQTERQWTARVDADRRDAFAFRIKVDLLEP